MLNEAAKRRPDALLEAPVILGDGQTWYLPKVRTRMARTSGSYAFRPVVPGIPEFHRLVDAIDETAERMSQIPREERKHEDVEAYFNAEFAAAEALIRRNYELTDEELSDVLSWALDEADDPDGAAVREDILAVIQGEGPKAGSGTDS